MKKSNYIVLAAVLGAALFSGCQEADIAPKLKATESLKAEPIKLATSDQNEPDDQVVEDEPKAVLPILGENGCDSTKAQFIGNDPQCVVVPLSCQSLAGKDGFKALNLKSANTSMAKLMPTCQSTLDALDSDKADEAPGEGFDPNTKVDWATCNTSNICELVKKTTAEIELLLPEAVKKQIQESNKAQEQDKK